MQHQKFRWFPKLVGSAFVILMTGASPARAACPLPYIITNGQPADASQVMANYNALVTCIQNGAPGGSMNAIQYNAGSGAFSGLGPLTDGQVVVGATGGSPQAATLTAGAGISIANGPGNITVSSTTAPSGALGSIQYSNGNSFGGLSLADGQLAVGVGASFNPANKSSTVALSNSNLTATTTGSAYSIAVATASQTAGKFYFEFQGVKITASNSGIGLGTGAVAANGYLGHDAQGIAIEPNGGVWINATKITTVAAVPANTSALGVAVDLTNKKLWFRTGPTGLWNNSASADPASNVGGISIAGLASFTLFPAAIWLETGGTATLALPSNSWLGIAPSGFNQWAGSSTVAAVTVTGAGSLSDSGILTSNAKTAQSTPTNPTGTTSTTAQVMMGLAGTITPGASGRVLFMVSGDGFNSNAVGNGYIVQLHYGTGTAPVNGAAAAGTAIGGAVQGVSAVVTSTQDIPFALQAMTTGLTVGTAYWYDIGVQAIGGGTATVENLSLTATEM